MVEAFKGMDTVVFIPSIIHPSFKRIPEVENLVYGKAKWRCSYHFHRLLRRSA